MSGIRPRRRFQGPPEQCEMCGWGVLPADEARPVTAEGHEAFVHRDCWDRWPRSPAWAGFALEGETGRML